jgi:hypothetical protein
MDFDLRFGLMALMCRGVGVGVEIEIASLKRRGATRIPVLSTYTLVTPHLFSCDMIPTLLIEEQLRARNRCGL